MKKYFVIFLFGLSSGLKLPDYIKPCSLSDPKIEECIRDHGNDAIPTIVKGDKTYKVISFDPFKAPEIVLESGENLKVKLTDVAVDNLKEIRILNVKFNYDKKHISIEAGMENINLQSQYDIDGRILVLPITGRGNINASFAHGVYKHDMDWELVELKGKQHLKIAKSSLDYTIKRGYFYLDNLFNGDKALGDQMNSFIDDNWEVVAEEIKPAVRETVKSVIDNVMSAFFAAVPLEDLFLP